MGFVFLVSFSLGVCRDSFTCCCFCVCCRSCRFGVCCAPVVALVVSLGCRARFSVPRRRASVRGRVGGPASRRVSRLRRPPRGRWLVGFGPGGGLVAAPKGDPPLGAVGFCGSRSLPGSFAPLVSSVVAGVVASGAPVVVGCASGSDQLVRAACPSASVLSVASGAFGSGPGAFAARSSALVRQVAGAGGVLVGFVSSPCPVGVVPASSWRSGASVSGSWSSLALAAGLGAGVVVFWCGPGAPLLPCWGGGWVPTGRGWVWSPLGAQASLF